MAFSRGILWVSGSQTGWQVFFCFAFVYRQWKTLLFQPGPLIDLVFFFLLSLNCLFAPLQFTKKILYCWIMTSILHNNWFATPFKIDIWRVNAKMITVIISDTFGKCLYWSFSVREYGKFCDIFTVLNLTGPLKNIWNFPCFLFCVISNVRMSQTNDDMPWELKEVVYILNWSYFRIFRRSNAKPK